MSEASFGLRHVACVRGGWDSLGLGCGFLEEADEVESSSVPAAVFEGGSGQLADDATLRVALVARHRLSDGGREAFEARASAAYGGRLPGDGPLRALEACVPSGVGDACLLPMLRCGCDGTWATTAHPQLASLRRVLRAKSGLLRQNLLIE